MVHQGWSNTHNCISIMYLGGSTIGCNIVTCKAAGWATNYTQCIGIASWTGLDTHSTENKEPQKHCNEPTSKNTADIEDNK